MIAVLVAWALQAWRQVPEVLGLSRSPRRRKAPKSVQEW